MSIVSSSRHTKQWRQEQTWYRNGKHNECELFQRQIISQLTGLQWRYTTGVRLNMDTLDLCHKKYPMKDNDGFEWTEDFDGFVEHQSTMFYLNLKFVCDQGGVQTRSLREVYHFIKTQLRHLAFTKKTNTYFINILDGNTSFKNIPKFTYLLNKFSSFKNRVFVGDMEQFQTFWSKEITHPSETKMSNHDLKKKKELGQFFTTNYKKIFKDLYVPSGVDIIEPFAGAGDLLQFIQGGANIVECYDIDPKQDYIIRRDTLQDPPCYDNRFVLTNPPYLARNKCHDKRYFDRYETDDLYKCFMKQLIGSGAVGGIVIIPINFWCSVRKADLKLRKDFLEKFHVVHLNIFEEQVFHDTTYSVCAFQFERKQDNNDTIHVSVYPSGKHFPVKLSSSNQFLIGGEIYNLERTHAFQITRLTKHNKDKQHTNILLKCIDDEKPIGVSIVDDPDVYVDETSNTSARSYATLVIDPPISLGQQEHIVHQFNVLLQQYRETYHSLFLSNYRENRRKRISFDLAYHIVGHLLEKESICEK